MKVATVDAADIASYCTLIGELMKVKLNFLLAEQ